MRKAESLFHQSVLGLELEDCQATLSLQLIETIWLLPHSGHELIILIRLPPRAANQLPNSQYF